MRTMYPSPVIVTMSITPSLSTSPRAGADPMKPTELALAFVSVQSSCPFDPLSIRPMPVSHVLTVSLPQPQQLAPTLPEMNTMTGESRLSILPSQFVSYMRPTVGVDHTSVSSGLVCAVGPQVHFTTGLS